MKMDSLRSPKIDLSKYNPQNIPPIDQVRVMEDSAFEDFIGEWLYATKRSEYEKIQLVGGAGDKGRDAIGTCLNGQVDYYQCKHYDHPLNPSEFIVEMGKLCYYTWAKEYPAPRNYYIVASHDIGPKLKDDLDQPDKLRKEVLTQWTERCEKQISNRRVPLNDELKEYIKKFDFEKVKHYPIQQVIAEHLPTVYGSLRFGTPSVNRPEKIDIPSNLEVDERQYVTALLSVYSREENKKICSIEELAQFEKWFQHLERQRRYYFSAEAIRRAVRDTFTDNDEFQTFKDEIYDGVIDIYESEFNTGLERLKKVLSQSAQVAVQKSLLASKLNWIGTSEKEGVCHMLVNDKRLEGWEK